MIIIEYCREGRAIGDFEWEEWLETVRVAYDKGGKADIRFSVSTVLPMTAVRLDLSTTRMDHSKVQFIINDTATFITEDGQWTEKFEMNHPDYEMTCAANRTYRQRGFGSYPSSN